MVANLRTYGVIHSYDVMAFFFSFFLRQSALTNPRSEYRQEYSAFVYEDTHADFAIYVLSFMHVYTMRSDMSLFI